MNDQNQLEALFEQALKCASSEARAAFLDEACRGQPELRARLNLMLEGHFMGQGFLEGAAETRQVPADQHVGAMIDRYKLLERIGEGGFGVVYLAEQREPVKRRVALKIIKPGMDTKQVIARFEAERQALALMDHPGIARVFDGGATDAGRPYFVMELVRGVPITAYCDEHQLSTGERLRLFVQVCEAVQHAHQKGIIHRDLKPSNILVTVNDGRAVPKVIDFGVAKATQQELTEKTVFTQFHHFIGTPAYVSPEQAQLTSLDIDTRSDIYSLGVLLYELLTGKTPFDGKDLVASGLDEMRRTIREKEPQRPSTRLSMMADADQTTLAQLRKSEPQKLISLLRGDLDWIAMKCLEKDRARRYETANGLATDVLRHLNDEPIVARPPSKLYEFQKTVRRHKVSFGVTATIIILLTVGIALTTWQERRAAAALNQLRATAPAFAAEARSLAAKEQFDEAIVKLNYAIQLRPDVPEYWVTKGDLLQSQLKLAEAAPAYREALRLKPGLTRAEASAKLCDELITAPLGEGGKLTRESLARLHVAMQQQQRSAAELMPVARLLGEGKKMLLEYWLDRLKELPVSSEKPLKERLIAEEDGSLGLDLSDTRITDLGSLIGMPLGALHLSNCKLISDFTPLQHLRSLKSLSLKNTAVTDLAPLKGLPLEGLDLTATPIFDISTLRGMRLRMLMLSDTRVVDLSPLTGMPLEGIEAQRIPATDYFPLMGAPLKFCNIAASGVRDLSFLRGSPVERLVLGSCSQARGFGVLAGLKSLDLLVLPESYRTLPAEELGAIEALRTHPTLKSIDTSERQVTTWQINSSQPKEEFWKAWDWERSLTEQLRGFRFNLSVLPGGKYRLQVPNQPLSDLSFLKTAPLAELLIEGTSVTDLRPLEQLALTRLDIRRTPVKDLSPLRAPVLGGSLRQLDIWRIPATDFSPIAACTNLEWLDAADTAFADLEMLRGQRLRTALLSYSKVTNISALARMPLERVNLENTAVTDLQPLIQCPTLTELIAPRGASNVSVLRSLPNLARLAYSEYGADRGLSAKEFWLVFEHGGITAKTVSIFSERSVQTPEDELLAMKVAAIQYWFGLEADYAATCKRFIEFAERKKESGTRERAAKNWCLQASGDAATLQSVLALAREAARTTDPTQRPWRQQTLGMAEFRAGNAEAAEAAFLRAEEAARPGHWDDRLSPFVTGPSRFFRAMILFRNGKGDEAKRLFDETAMQMPPIPENAARVLPVEVDQDRLLYWLTYREAKAELKLGTSSRP